MKRTLSIFIILIVTSLMSGCILSKTPSTNNITMYVGEQKVFSVIVLPTSKNYTWTLDGVTLSNTERSYSYNAEIGTHTLTVKAKQSYGTDTQIWIINVDIFNKTFGGINYDCANAVQQTSDGGYILAGETYPYWVGIGDAWLVKTDANGNRLWNKTFGGNSSDGANSVQQTSDGGYILAAYTVSYGAGSGDAWLIKTDEDGNKLWDKTFGGSYTDFAYAVQQTSDGGYILTGMTGSYAAGSVAWLIKTDSEGNTCDFSDNGNCYENESKWAKTFGEGYGDCTYAVQQTSDGGYILTGMTGSYGDEYGDAWLIKTDPNGNKLWDKTYGGSSADGANSVQQTSDGGYILAGATYSFGAGDDDAWLIKTDASGNELWEKIFGGSNIDEACDVQQTSDGGYILAGMTLSYGTGQDDAWLIKTDEDGNKLWDKIFGGRYYDSAKAVQQTGDSGYILAGIYQGDAWLIKTDANGNAPATPTP
jgi:hypothetical protein